MKNDVFIARLARGAMASALVGVSAMPSQNVATLAQSVAVPELICSNCAGLSEAITQMANNGPFVTNISQTPSVWDKKLEREFRKLALEEAKGTIGKDDVLRLDELNHWRDQMQCPLTADQILLQMKRDRLLARMESVLKEYVEFQETANKTRDAA